MVVLGLLLVAFIQIDHFKGGFFVMEKIIVKPLEIRGYGNILEGKNKNDISLYNSYITVSKELINDVNMSYVRMMYINPTAFFAFHNLEKYLFLNSEDHELGFETKNLTLTGDEYKIGFSDKELWVGPLYLFYDPCTSDRSNEYVTRGKLSDDELSVVISYSESQEAYSVYGTGGDSFAFFVIPEIRGVENVRIRVKVNLNSSTAYNQCMLGVTDDLISSSPTNAVFDAFRIRADNKRDYLHNSDQEVSGSSKSVTVRQRYVYLEFAREGSSITGRVYDAGMGLLSEYNYTTSNTYENPYYFIGLNCRYTTDVKYIQEIKVEEL